MSAQKGTHRASVVTTIRGSSIVLSAYTVLLSRLCSCTGPWGSPLRNGCIYMITSDYAIRFCHHYSLFSYRLRIMGIWKVELCHHLEIYAGAHSTRYLDAYNVAWRIGLTISAVLLPGVVHLSDAGTHEQVPSSKMEFCRPLQVWLDWGAFTSMTHNGNLRSNSLRISCPPVWFPDRLSAIHANGKPIFIVSGIIDVPWFKTVVLRPF